MPGRVGGCLFAQNYPCSEHPFALSEGGVGRGGPGRRSRSSSHRPRGRSCCPLRRPPGWGRGALGTGKGGGDSNRGLIHRPSGGGEGGGKVLSPRKKSCCLEKDAFGASLSASSPQINTHKKSEKYWRSLGADKSCRLACTCWTG